MSDQSDYDLFGYDDPADEAAPAPDAVLAALLEAGPEAAEHLLKAAQELLLAAKAVVDAGERALEAHRRVGGGGRPPTQEPEPARATAGHRRRSPIDAAEPDEPPRRVRRIDLA